MTTASAGSAAPGPQSAGPVVVHNHDAAPRDRFDVYLQHLASSDDPWRSSPHAAPPERFLAWATELRGSSSFATCVSASPVRRTLTRAKAEHAGPLRIRLTGFRAGRGAVRAHGSDHAVGPSSLLLGLTDEPSELVLDTMYRTVCVEVPADQVAFSEHDLWRLSREVVAGRHTRALNALFFPISRSVLDPAALGPGAFDPDGVDRYLAGLVDLLLRTVDGRQPDHADTAAVRRQQAESCIRAHIADPNLSAGMVAAALGVSDRLVYKLFEDRAESLREFVQLLRVERAERLLARRDPQPLTLEVIARESGFGSVKTLTRAFHRVHGAAPAQHRSRTHA